LSAYAFSLSFDVLLFSIFLFFFFFFFSSLIHNSLNWIVTTFFFIYILKGKKMEFVTSLHRSNWISKKNEFVVLKCSKEIS
jgi:hypothetical protein